MRAKECVGDYWLIQVKSKEEAVQCAKRAPMGEHERIRVGMRCVECNHEWHFEMPTVGRKAESGAVPRHN